jgi:DNA-binding response OmpR family regulator
MKRPLTGRVILVIEDEVLISYDIQQAFKDAGATVVAVRTLAAALVAVEDNSISAAIVDHVLGDGDSSEICARLKERKVPFITYSGYSHLDGECADAEHINKPVDPLVLVATIQGLLARQPTAGT